jgi:hypothetical protein
MGTSAMKQSIDAQLFTKQSASKSAPISDKPVVNNTDFFKRLIFLVLLRNNQIWQFF